MKKQAKMYVQFMMDKLKEMYEGKYKSPFQIPDKKEQKKFHETVKEEWKKFKKESHVKQLDVLNKDSVQEYFSHYLEDIEVKDIDMSYHLDRFDLSLWAHMGDFMFSLGASYPQAEVGEAYVEIYKDLGDGKKEKIVNKMTFDNLEKAMKEIKKVVEGMKPEEEEKKEEEMEEKEEDMEEKEEDKE